VACVAHTAQHSECDRVQVVTGWEMRLSLAVIILWRGSIARSIGLGERNAAVRKHEHENVAEKI